MTKLAKKRQECGLSQSMLAKNSEVSVRMIQYYEQGQNDINKAEAQTIKKLAQALGCAMEDLID